jgi:hypothetical protein
MKKLFSTIIIVSVCLQTALAITPINKSRRSLQASADDDHVETRVYLRRQCLLSESAPKAEPQFVMALGAIFLPIIIGKLIGGVSSAIRKAGTAETLKDGGSRLTYLYRLSNYKDPEHENKPEIKYTLNPNNECVILVRGIFDAPDTTENNKLDKVDFLDESGANPSNGIFIQEGQENLRKNRLRRSGIPVRDISLVYEAALNLSDDRLGFNYDSRFLEVNNFQSSKSGSRGLVVSLAFYGAAAKEKDATLSLALLNLGEVQKGTIWGPEQLKQNNRNAHSAWLGGVGISEAALKAIEHMTVPVGEFRGLMPVTVEGTFAETSKANDTLLFIADVLDAGKGDAAKAIAGDLLDSSKEATTASEALDKLKSDEETAYAAYLKAAAALEAVCSQVTHPFNEAQQLLIFNRDSTYASWLNKLSALKKYGIAPIRTETKYVCINEN